MKGHYIVVEGIDGSGKTSICSKISTSLIQRGYKILQISEPSHSEIGFAFKKSDEKLTYKSNFTCLIICR